MGLAFPNAQIAGFSQREATTAATIRVVPSVDEALIVEAGRRLAAAADRLPEGTTMADVRRPVENRRVGF